MAKLHRKAVVMLDHLVDRHGPGSWPISVVRDTEREATMVRQFDGAPPMLVSRDAYRATPGRATSLLNTRTGERLPGRVYRMERVDGG